jgi:hypothetical protein
MRIALGLALVAVLLWIPAGCRRGRKAEAEAAAAGGPRIATTVHMGDPKSAGQLVSGFYDIEDNAWRWTGRQFTVELGTPPGAAQNGATLELQLTVPQPVIDQLKSIQLNASVDGNLLPPETYSQPGVYSYQRDVPAALCGKESVRISFELDKAMAPGATEQRELGVVASSVGLKAK